MRLPINKSLLILTLLLLSLVACTGGAKQATPTIDQNVMFTNVASTIIAQVTVDAALHPTAVPTQKPQESSRSLPTLPRLQITIPAQNQPTVKPLFTVTPTKKPVLDAGVVLETFPSDGSVVTFGTFPDIYWTVQNTGKTTWTKDYYYQYYSGDDIALAKSYVLIREVRPGEIIKLPLDANLSSAGGYYSSVWVLTNSEKWPNTTNFVTMTANFRVVPGTVVQPTAAPAATSTGGGPEDQVPTSCADPNDPSCI